MIQSAIAKEKDEIFRKGEESGIDIGKRQGAEDVRRQIVQSMASNGFPTPEIARLLVLPEIEVKRLLLPKTPEE